MSNDSVSQGQITAADLFGRYAQHDLDCHSLAHFAGPEHRSGPCSCGLDAAVRQMVAYESPTLHTDDLAVNRFAVAMKAKMAKKRGEGRGGWEMCSIAELRRMLHAHLNKGDPVDVANFCMMLWNLTEVKS